MEHPAYNPIFPASDHHIFGPFKDDLRARQFSTNKDVKEVVHKWLYDQM